MLKTIGQIPMHMLPRFFFHHFGKQNSHWPGADLWPDLAFYQGYYIFTVKLMLTEMVHINKYNKKLI